MAAPNILCDTAGMTNAQWLAARMHGPSGKIPYTVGGSDVGLPLDNAAGTVDDQKGTDETSGKKQRQSA